MTLLTSSAASGKATDALNPSTGSSRLGLFVRLLVISTIIVAVTDTVEFIHLRRNPDVLTPQYLILVIFITVLPIAINLWYWLVRRR